MAVVTVHRVILLVGVLMILLAAFGVSMPGTSLFELGVGVCFAAGLVP
jgi:hypothetical protein